MHACVLRVEELLSASATSAALALLLLLLY